MMKLHSVWKGLRRIGVLRPVAALLAISLILPLALFALAAWQNRQDVVREAETHVERTTRILHEHALKVFETHQLMISHINERLRGFDWANAAAVSELHDFLDRVRADSAQVATISITDATGKLRASSRAYPADPSINLSDLDYFQALSVAEQPLPFVSQSTIGRQSHEFVFNIAQRVRGPDPARFDGVIAISIRRAYFEGFYREIEHDYDHLVILARADGYVLANEPRNDMLVMPTHSRLRIAMENPPNSFFMTPIMFAGTKRIIGFEKIGAFPIFIGFGITWESALEPWWRNMVGYGLVAFLSSMALLFVSAIAMRHSVLEAKATTSWRDTAALLRNEMTQRMQIEEQLRQSQKMEAVGRLTGGVAHDFNNLLTIVIGSLDLLSRRMKDGDPRHQALVRNAMDGASRAAALTARLLAFSRQHPLDPKPLDANALIGGMSTLFRQSLGESIEIDFVHTKDLWRTFADPNQLENAILNLTVNARDAMPDGGTLVIETANASLDEAYRSSNPQVSVGDYVMISVTDTGTGMTPDVVSRAFEPFYTTKPVGKGTGLGLSQVYGFTRQSGGHATIFSEVAQGTSIKLYLPRWIDKEAVPGADATSQPEGFLATPSNKTILIVEDEELVRRFSAAALRESGYIVLEAATGAEGLGQLREHPDVALLFTDIILKGMMNGRVLADQAAVMRPSLPILFTTGYRGIGKTVAGDSDEGPAFIGKPFTTSDLIAKIETLLASPVSRLSSG